MCAKNLPLIVIKLKLNNLTCIYILYFQSDLVQLGKSIHLKVRNQWGVGGNF